MRKLSVREVTQFSKSPLSPAISSDEMLTYIFFVFLIAIPDVSDLGSSLTLSS